MLLSQWHLPTAQCTPGRRARCVCVQAGIQCRKEVPVPVRMHGDKRKAPRPADLLLINWDHGVDTAIDFTVSHPLALAHQPLVLKNVTRHGRQEEAAKLESEGPMCAHSRWAFQPAAFNPWGGMGPSACEILHEISKRATAELAGWLKTRRLTEIYQGISLALARHVARQLHLRSRVLDS